MQLSKTIGKMGKFTGEGGEIPIYGVESVILTRDNDWKIMNVGIKSATLAMWKGDQPVEYSFDFQLVAGVGDVATRSDLNDKMKLMHSWASHTNGEKFNSPLKVKLQLANYINCAGSIKRVSTAATGPWDNDGYPTMCKFTGIFLLMPGYTDFIDGKGASVDILKNATKLSASEVLSSFYKG